MKSRIIAAVVAVAALAAVVAPASASASYTISKLEAQQNTRDAVHTLYDVGLTSTSCRPQGTSYDRRYTYHRWVCGWAARTHDGDMVSGALRITGHSDDTYGYLVLRGARYA